MKKLRIAIADDHPLVLAGLNDLLANDLRFEVTGTLSSPTALIQHIQEHMPDIVLCDFVMPGDNRYGDGLNFASYMIRNFPRIRLLVVTMISNPLVISSLYRCGVSGVILKTDPPLELLRALDTLRLGRRYLRSDMDVRAELADADDADATASLSPKEIEVLRRFIDGQSLTDIAHSLNRSLKTISNQKRSAMRKLNLNNDQELIAYCVRSGLFL